MPRPAIGRAIHSTRGPMYFVSESVTRYAAPRATSSMPRVTMNEGIDQRTETMPLARPQIPPMPRQATSASQKGQAQSAMAIPRTHPERASTEPTDRSIPPITRTSVIPTETTVKSAIWLTMIRSVCPVQK